MKEHFVKKDPRSSPPSQADAETRDQWEVRVARTTAGLAILAALMSAQNANEFSKTILVQGEVNDAWNFYQAEKIKMHQRESEGEILSAIALGSAPRDPAALADLERRNEQSEVEYRKKVADLKVQADDASKKKALHERRSMRYGLAFMALQAGVVVCTLAAGGKRPSLWRVAIALGVVGLVLAANAFFLWL